MGGKPGQVLGLPQKELMGLSVHAALECHLDCHRSVEPLLLIQVDGGCASKIQGAHEPQPGQRRGLVHGWNRTRALGLGTILLQGTSPPGTA